VGALAVGPTLADGIADSVGKAEADAEGDAEAGAVGDMEADAVGEAAPAACGTIIRTETTTGGFIGVLSLPISWADRIWAPGMTPGQV